tara:strand:+ start:516 stop:686 length:171 start_codon:yes stop_codon:yes gene_type:complete
LTKTDYSIVGTVVDTIVGVVGTVVDTVVDTIVGVVDTVVDTHNFLRLAKLCTCFKK